MTPDATNQSRIPVYLAAGSVGVAALAASIYAFAGLEELVQVTLPTFFIGNALYALTTTALAWALWRRHELFGLGVKIFVLAWSGLVAVYAVLLPVLFTLTVNLNTTQLRWVNFGWMWEFAVLGVFLLGGSALLAARRIIRFARTGKTDHPQSLYREVVRYPARTGWGVLVIVLISFSLGVAQVAVGGELPPIEIAKALSSGIVSALFVSIVYYLGYDTILRPVRARLEAEYDLEDIAQRSYSVRTLTVSLALSIAAILILNIVAIQSFQRIVRSYVEGTVTEDMAQVRELIADGQGSASFTDITNQLKIGEEGHVVTAQNLWKLPVSLEEQTQNFVLARTNTVRIDRRGANKIVAIFREPLSGETYVSITELNAFYGPLYSTARIFASLSMLILVSTALIIWLANRSLTNSITKLAQAVRSAQGSTKPFTFDTHTADELEDLSHAFAYYVNRARELQQNLRQKVKERTAELVRIEREKRDLEVETAEKLALAEREKRETAEELNEELEQRVSERTAALRDAVEHLKELDKVKSEFISVASHQLRTPLTAIRWAWRSLLNGEQGELSEEQKQIAQVGHDRSLFMVGLVNELLNVTRIESEEFELDKQTNSFRAFLQSIADDAARLAKEKGVTFSASFGEDIPEMAFDEEKLRMALENVFTNAVKYTPPGKSVSASAAMDGDYVVLTISDQGIGIPEDQQYRIFTKFYRGSNAKKLHTEGTGLGLYISKSIIAKHGGTIDFESEEGNGTTFTITLPTSPPDQEEGKADLVSKVLEEHESTQADADTSNEVADDEEHSGNTN